MIRNIVLSLIFITPGISFANVYVSEVAWMGNSSSANHEWVELFNSGSSSVDLSGWSLKAQDGSPEIVLSGSIGAGQYFILERTSDASLPGVSADLVYSGALSNSGEVLVLSNGSGEVDRVDGSGGWSIGGNNETKETLQRNGSGWKTATATPRAGGVAESVDEEEESETVTSSGSDTEYVYEPAGPDISLETKEKVIGFVGSKTSFSATAFDVYGKEFEKAVYLWSFGDGGDAVGKEVQHVYVSPGTYQAVVYARYGMWETEDMIEVVVKAVPVEVVRSGGDAVVLKNVSDVRVNLSGWSLVERGKRFQFPERTYMLPGAEIAVPHRVSGFGAYGQVGLVYPNGVSAYTPPVYSVGSVAQKEEVAVATSPSPLVAAPIAAPVSRGVSVWLYAFIGLLLVGAGGIVYVRRYG